MLLNQSCSSAKYKSGEIQIKKTEKSTQYKDGIFLNYQENYNIITNFITSYGGRARHINEVSIEEQKKLGLLWQ